MSSDCTPPALKPASLTSLATEVMAPLARLLAWVGLARALLPRPRRLMRWKEEGWLRVSTVMKADWLAGWKATISAVPAETPAAKRPISWAWCAAGADSPP